MQTNKWKKDWRDRILDYMFTRNLNNRSTPHEDIVNVEEVRRNEMKNNIINDIIESSPETGILRLIYRYSPPPKPTPAVNILCKRIGKRISELNESSLEELMEYHFLVSEKRTHDRVPALDIADDIIQHPAGN